MAVRVIPQSVERARLANDTHRLSELGKYGAEVRKKRRAQRKAQSLRDEKDYEDFKRKLVYFGALQLAEQEYRRSNNYPVD